MAERGRNTSRVGQLLVVKIEYRRHSFTALARRFLKHRAQFGYVTLGIEHRVGKRIAIAVENADAKSRVVIFLANIRPGKDRIEGGAHRQQKRGGTVVM